MSDIFSSSLQDNITLKYLRSDGYYYTMNKSYELAFYEILTNTQELGQVSDFTQLQLDRAVLNDQGQWYLEEALTEIQRQVYFLLINMNDPALSFFPTRLANAFIAISNNSVN